MLTEIDQVKFVVMMNGQAICAPQPTRHLAEMVLMNLPQQSRSLAEIVVVSNNGQQLLLG